MTTTTTQTSEFQIYFGHDRILDKVYFSSLAQVMEAISNNIFMFENDNFQFSENSITVEIMTLDENNNDTFEKLFRIPVSKFNLIKKMNLGL
jgi:hypothetical protein